jgi:signal transduction histidine kinase
MVQKDPEALIGTSFQDLIAPDGQSVFAEIFKQARQDPARGEFCLKRTNGECVPVQLSIYKLGPEKLSGIAIIATDITERMQAEEKIRNLASKLTIVEQEERHRISQVLHDDLQQRLFALKAQLSFLSDFFEKDQVPASFYAELDQIQSSLSEAVALTRNLSIDLNPVVLHGEGLAEAMSWLSFRVKEQYGLHIDLEAQESFSELDYHVRMLLFQSIRELLFNVVKHAGVSEATVTLERVNGQGRIIVSDSGRGFDAETIMKSPTRAHGLLIIQDRLSLLGCQMDLTSRVGEGTRVEIELPGERPAS